MKKKREAKRQAKQNQEGSNIDNDVHKITELIDNEIQLKIKKIKSVCFS